MASIQTGEALSFKAISPKVHRAEGAPQLRGDASCRVTGRQEQDNSSALGISCRQSAHPSPRLEFYSFL
jgi:hypothetical protein